MPSKCAVAICRAGNKQRGTHRFPKDPGSFLHFFTYSGDLKSDHSKSGLFEGRISNTPFVGRFQMVLTISKPVKNDGQSRPFYTKIKLKTRLNKRFKKRQTIGNLDMSVFEIPIVVGRGKVHYRLCSCQSTFLQVVFKNITFIFIFSHQLSLKLIDHYTSGSAPTGSEYRTFQSRTFVQWGSEYRISENCLDAIIFFIQKLDIFSPILRCHSSTTGSFGILLNIIVS